MTQQVCSPCQSSSFQNTHQKMLTKETVYTFEKICRAILLLTCAAFAFLFYKLYAFQSHVFGEQNSLNHFKDFCTYGMFFSVAYTAVDFFLHYLCEDLIIKYFISGEKYPTREQQQKRAYTLVKWGYSIIFYSSCAIANYYLLSSTSYGPSWFGGKDGYAVAQQYILNYSQNSFPIKILYMIQFGKHFSRLIIHALIKQQGNYYEFTLHHMLSVALIVFSYLSNIWLAGLVVLLTHDASDACLLVARFYKDYKYSNSILTNILGVMGVLSWIILRGYMFLKYLVYPVYDRFLFYPLKDEVAGHIVYWPAFYISMMLWALLAMDYVWIFASIKAIVALILPKKNKNIQGKENKNK